MGLPRGVYYVHCDRKVDKINIENIFPMANKIYDTFFGEQDETSSRETTYIIGGNRKSRIL